MIWAFSGYGIKRFKDISVQVQKTRPLVALWIRYTWVKVFCRFENSHSRKGKTVALY